MSLAKSIKMMILFFHIINILGGDLDIDLNKNAVARPSNVASKKKEVYSKEVLNYV